MSGTEPATGSYLVKKWEDSGQQSDDVHHKLIHFGVHRRMRMNGVKEGDTVHYVDRELRWEYPRQELEAKVKPAAPGRAPLMALQATRVSSCGRTLHPWKAMNSMKVWRRPSRRWWRF